MTVTIPHDAEPARIDALKREERERARALQREGVWRHLWRVAGEYRNLSVFDVEDPAQLNDILMSLPLFPFMAMRITALCRHPSSIHDDDR